MTGRRRFLKSILGLVLAVPAARLAAASPADLAAPAGLIARRHGAYFLLDGWVLTARDIERLGAKVVG